MKKDKNKYVKAIKMYLSFLNQEIPNLIQIFGIPTLFSAWTNSSTIKQFAIPLLISLLTSFYLTEKMFLFRKDQITDQLSIQNRHHIDDNIINTVWEICLIITSITFALISNLVSRSFR